MSLKSGRWLMGIALVTALGVMVSCGGGGNPTDPATSGGNRELNSGDFGPGGRFEHRFTNAGAFHYHCIHHSVMRGSVVVSDAALDKWATENKSQIDAAWETDKASFSAGCVPARE